MNVTAANLTATNIATSAPVGTLNVYATTTTVKKNTVINKTAVQQQRHKATRQLLSAKDALNLHETYACMPYAILENIRNVKIETPLLPCDVCPLYRSKRTAIATKSTGNRESTKFSLWGTDYKGPFETNIGGSHVGP